MLLSVRAFLVSESKSSLCFGRRGSSPAMPAEPPEALERKLVVLGLSGGTFSCSDGCPLRSYNKI